MTHELLQEANRINHSIINLKEQITLVEDMHHCDKEVQLRCDQIGSISITGALKDAILNIVLSQLNNAMDDLKDKLRLL